MVRCRPRTGRTHHCRAAAQSAHMIRCAVLQHTGSSRRRAVNQLQTKICAHPPRCQQSMDCHLRETSAPPFFAWCGRVFGDAGPKMLHTCALCCLYHPQSAGNRVARRESVGTGKCEGHSHSFPRRKKRMLCPVSRPLPPAVHPGPRQPPLGCATSIRP